MFSLQNLLERLLPESIRSKPSCFGGYFGPVMFAAAHDQNDSVLCLLKR
jgi:hypothetical protein